MRKASPLPRGHSGEPGCREPTPLADGGRRALRTGIATPLARKLAREAGLALDRATGSGLAGRIIRRDILQMTSRGATAAPDRPAGHRQSPAAADDAQPGQQPTSANDPAVSAPMPREPIPAAWMLAEADLSHLRHRQLPAVGPSQRPLEERHAVLAGCLDAVLQALHRFPLLNSAWEEQGIRLRPAIHLAVVDIRPGETGRLLIPHAERCPPDQLAAAAAALIRGGSQPTQAAIAPTFTIAFTAGAADALHLIHLSLPPDQTASLAIGRPLRRAVGSVQGLAIRDIATLALTFDHRVLDGAPAALFLRDLKERLEGAEAAAGSG